MVCTTRKWKQYIGNIARMLRLEKIPRVHYKYYQHRFSVQKKKERNSYCTKKYNKSLVPYLSHVYCPASLPRYTIGWLRDDEQYNTGKRCELLLLLRQSQSKKDIGRDEKTIGRGEKTIAPVWQNDSAQMGLSLRPNGVVTTALWRRHLGVVGKPRGV